MVGFPTFVNWSCRGPFRRRAPGLAPPPERQVAPAILRHLHLDANGREFIFGRMRMISVWLCILTLATAAVPRARAQDAATQAQLDKISGEIQDVQDALAQQDKRITALEQKISDLQDKTSQPAGNDYASADDLKKLAEQVQEIDKKRQEDNEKILDAIAKLGGKVRKPDIAQTPTTTDNNPGPTANPGGPQQGYEYVIAPGNTLSAICKAYRAQGVKVSVDEILKANPGLDPSKLIVGKKIFIPAPQ
jgi:LysM repeat protein